MSLLAGSAHAGGASAYGRLLVKHVHPGTVNGIRTNLVDYRALGTDADFAQAVRDLAAAQPDALQTKDERFAFWANAYNLLAIKTVVDRYPIDSIRDAGSIFSPIWKHKVGVVGGKEYALDEIEHGILRKQFAEPRVHFALVCASLSCPDLRTEPYDAARLDAQLDEQAHSFLGNETKGLVPGVDGKSARLSSIFEWFADDFAAGGGVVAFVKQKSPAAVQSRIADLTEGGVSYLPYDWSLTDFARAR